MRCRHMLWTGAFLALAAPVQAQDKPKPAATAPSQAALLSSRQIDRYHAIEQVRSQLQVDPRNLGNWILMGELAQEVANDLPASQSKPYYTLARESYDNALKLDPNNAGLKAAANFARQHEQNADQLSKSRAALASSYLSAQRQELAKSNYTPSVPTFGSPTPSATPAPFRRGRRRAPRRTCPCSPDILFPLFLPALRERPGPTLHL